MASVEHLLGALAGRLDSRLWRGREFAQRLPRTGGIATGFPALDAELFDHGWPRAGLTELLLNAHGIGELRLLAPALAALSAAEPRWIAWIDPPFVPYAPALEAAGVDLAKVLLIRPRQRLEAPWAMEQALKTGACSAVLGWLAEPRLRFTEVRRLLLAARQGRTWASLLRPATAAGGASAAELRLLLRPSSGDRLRVDVVKRRGSWPLTGLELHLDETSAARRRAAVREQLSRWRQRCRPRRSDRAVPA